MCPFLVFKVLFVINQPQKQEDKGIEWSKCSNSSFLIFTLMMMESLVRALMQL